MGGRAPRPSSHDVAAADALRRIVQTLRLSASEVERATGLSGAQLLVLRIVGAEPGLGLTDVMERTLTDLSSVSVVVTALKDRGLLERSTSPQDGRRAVLTTTPAGRALLRRAPRPAQEPLLTAIQRMSSGDARRLSLLLASLAAAMGASAKRAPLFFDRTRRRSESR